MIDNQWRWEMIPLIGVDRWRLIHTDGINVDAFY